MITSQRLITQFFKIKKKNLITDYFKSVNEPQVKTEKLHFYKPATDYKKARHYLNKHRHLYNASTTKNGYCYCASSDFTEYAAYTTHDRFIRFRDQEIFIARGTRVAEAKTDSDSALEHISVDERFRRQGIGKYLIRFINKHDQQFHVYAGVEHNSRYRLTEEGAALIRACENSGILNDEQVILSTVPCSPASLYSSRSYR